MLNFKPVVMKDVVAHNFMLLCLGPPNCIKLSLREVCFPAVFHFISMYRSLCSIHVNVQCLYMPFSFTGCVFVEEIAMVPSNGDNPLNEIDFSINWPTPYVYLCVIESMAYQLKTIRFHAKWQSRSPVFPKLHLFQTRLYIV